MSRHRIVILLRIPVFIANIIFICMFAIGDWGRRVCDAANYSLGMWEYKK
jgi:hypothetical protein